MMYRVYWDNNANACGVFPNLFETEADAQAFADAWVKEMCATEGIDPEAPEAYSAEVIETTDAEVVDLLARRFAAVIRSWLNPYELAAVNYLNSTPQYAGCCATHNHCDANMAMIEAFRDLYGRENRADSDADTDAINAAWDAAKANKFYPEG